MLSNNVANLYTQTVRNYIMKHLHLFHLQLQDAEFFFTKFLVGGGDLISRTIFSPRWGWNQMGGELVSGMESDEGGGQKCPLQQN